MKLKKLEKYKKGNFIFNEKHKYARNELKKIIQSILLNKLIGGNTAVQSAIDTILGSNQKNQNQDLLDNNKLEVVINQIKKEMGNKGLLIDDTENKVFEELINADTEMVNEFQKYNQINDDTMYVGLENPEEVKKELIQMQKALFDLQVKIIFSKLRKVSKSNIQPLLAVINKKVLAMNAYMEEQNRIFEEESVNEPTSPVKKKVVKKQITKDTKISQSAKGPSSKVISSTKDITDQFTEKEKEELENIPFSVEGKFFIDDVNDKLPNNIIDKIYNLVDNQYTDIPSKNKTSKFIEKLKKIFSKIPSEEITGNKFLEIYDRLLKNIDDEGIEEQDSKEEEQDSKEEEEQKQEEIEQHEEIDDDKLDAEINAINEPIIGNITDTYQNTKNIMDSDIMKEYLEKINAMGFTSERFTNFKDEFSKLITDKTLTEENFSTASNELYNKYYVDN